MSYFLKSIFFQNVHLQLKAEYTLYFINDMGQQGILKLFCFDGIFWRRRGRNWNGKLNTYDFKNLAYILGSGNVQLQALRKNSLFYTTP